MYWADHRSPPLRRWMPVQPTGAGTITPLTFCLDEGDCEEELPQLEHRRDAEEALTQGDESGDILNPIGIRMLQLHLVVVQQPPEERMGGCREASLVDVHERDDVPRWRLRLRFAGGDDPLLRCGERAQESFGHKAIQASGGHVRALPERHGFFFFGGWIRRLDGLAAAKDVAMVKAVVAEKVRGPSSPSFISLLFSSL